jgi:excisionase family DNA binding protein
MKYLSVPDAAKEIGVSATTMREMLDDGDMPYIRPRKHRKVSVQDLERFKVEHAGGPAAARPKQPTHVWA